MILNHYFTLFLITIIFFGLAALLKDYYKFKYTKSLWFSLIYIAGFLTTSFIFGLQNLNNFTTLSILFLILTLILEFFAFKYFFRTSNKVALLELCSKFTEILLQQVIIANLIYFFIMECSFIKAFIIFYIAFSLFHLPLFIYEKRFLASVIFVFVLVGSPIFFLIYSLLPYTFILAIITHLFFYIFLDFIYYMFKKKKYD